MSVPTERSALPRRVRQIALKVLPTRLHLPLRYYYRRWFRTLDPELYFLDQLLRSRRTAIDVGANTGIYTYALWRLCQRVEAFEPLDGFADVISAFGAPNVRVHRVALSSFEGTARLQFPGEGGEIDAGRGSLSSAGDRSGGASEEVPVKTLDSYGFTGVSLIKIDVEGHELDVIRGAEATIRRERPVLLVEIEQRHLPVPMTTVFDHLAGLGYRASFVRRGALRPIEEFSAERDQLSLLPNVYSRDYINNFVFQPVP